MVKFFNNFVELDRSEVGRVVAESMIIFLKY